MEKPTVMPTMVIGEWVGGSCAAYAIKNLGSQKGALKAMIGFVKSQLIGSTSYGMNKKDGTPYNSVLASHYIFIAGPEKEGTYHSKRWVAYGTEFAQFIRKNKLGLVVTLPKAVNLRHHPDTDCQVWLWQPNRDAIVKWYSELPPEATVVKMVNMRDGVTESTRCVTCTYAKNKHTGAEGWTCPYGYGEWPKERNEDDIP